MKKIAFLDRDGTLIFEPYDTKQIDSLEKLKILPNIVHGLKKIQNEGYELILISNQDGLGTKSFPMNDFTIPHNKFLECLKKEAIEFKEIFICPHFLKEDCQCRKPKLGLIQEFIANNTIDYEKSFILGDRDSDIEFGKNLGIATFAMQTNSRFPRLGFKKRQTNETNIFVGCNIDGKGIYNIHTGIGFFDHMLEQLSKHSLIDLVIHAKGDLHIDEHHTIEDVAITLGEALSDALEKRTGIRRFSTVIPMDDTLVETAIDLCGRSYLVFNATFKRDMVGDFPTELTEHFFKSLSDSLKSTIHINVKYSKNSHHQIEAIFKSFAKSLRFCTELDCRIENVIPSTKGIL